MTATIRLDNALENTLNKLTDILHKKKSDIIREAISFYAQNVEKQRKLRILCAVNKTKDIDHKEFQDFEGVLNDAI